MRFLRLLFAMVFALSCAATEDQLLGPKDGADMPPTDLQRVRVESVAPDFTLESKDGNPISLSGFQGKNVILVFYRGYW